MTSSNLPCNYREHMWLLYTGMSIFIRSERRESKYVCVFDPTFGIQGETPSFNRILPRRNHRPIWLLRQWCCRPDEFSVFHGRHLWNVSDQSDLNRRMLSRRGVVHVL